VQHWFQPILRLVVVLLVIAGLYALVRLKRAELVDFVVPRTAAARYLAREPLYRPEDGHYQFKYLPVFAPVMVPFALLPKEAAELAWFGLLVSMALAFARTSIAVLPDRRLSARALAWFAFFLTGKFLVKELAFGQFNLPMALLMFGAVVAAQRRHGLIAGVCLAAGAFVKPYALVLLPWLTLTQGWRAAAACLMVLSAGLLVPASSYGWNGNLMLLREWYRTVVETTRPNLMAFENISFASMWAKWIEPGQLASAFAAITAIAAVGAGLLVVARRRVASEPNYLEGAYFLVLVPLLSPQGWDYLLLLATPAYLLLVDRWNALPRAWQVTVSAAFFLTSFTIFDLLGRTLYTWLMEVAGVSVGAVLIAACLVRLRRQALA
jgi:glycosyl transferase family 87